MTDAVVQVTTINAEADVTLEFDSKNKLPTDDVTLSENFSKVTVYSRAFTDSITITDVPGIGQIYTESPAEGVSIGDEIAVAAQYNLLFTESISTSDVDLVSVGWGVNVADSVSTGDTPGIGDIYVRTPSDSVTITDIPTVDGGTTYPIIVSDSVNVSDTLLTYHDGMLNTNMLNTRLISAGSLEVIRDDVTITIT